ncbi:MAG TPA: TonB-dependent receptor [Phenylobacterium sp.]|nr:TonB-dependent receptor [Phenylobacterium sp.]
MNVNRTRCALLLGTVALAAVSGGAAAQSVPKPGAAVGLDEIVVTAQRRGQNLQEVPIAVSAITGDQVAAMGGSSSADLTMLVPSVVYIPNVAGGGMSIRGIGGLNAGSDEPANAIYIDGVYQAAAASVLFQFNGIERIEVLKGPQGTLFGRNATGGVVQIISRDPTQEPKGEASLSYGNYDTVDGKLYFNTPITDSIAINVAAFGFNQADGWGKNVFTGKDAYDGWGWGVRSKIKWTSEDGGTDLTLLGLYTEGEPAAVQAQTIIPGTFNAQGLPNPGFWNTRSNRDQRRQTLQYTYAATLRHDLGFARLLSISAYNTVHNDGFFDPDLTTNTILHATLTHWIRTFTQEVQLQSQPDSKIQWVAGAFYMHNSLLQHSILSGASQAAVGGLADTPTRPRTKSYSAFGQATYPLTDTLKVTAGLRYTIDQRHITGQRYTGLAPQPVLIADRRKEDRKLTWRFALDKQFNDRILGYVSYSRGFKSGLFNGSDPLAPPVEPQTLDAYEVGLKVETDDRRLRVNSAVFYYSFKDLQFRSFNDAGTVTVFRNAGDATSYGLDVDAAFKPIEPLTLTAAVSLIESEYEQTSLFVPCYTVRPPPLGAVIVGKCLPGGNKISQSPKLVFTAGAYYDLSTSVGDFQFSGTYNHNSGYYMDPSNFKPLNTGKFDMVNSSVTWTPTSRRFTVSLWGKNLLNEKVFGAAEASTFGASYYPQPPRTYGVTFGVDF